ncbi:MAG: translation initiation factor IF-2 N-terminal domain-containing protein, partial [Oscillospiraceae bacterium]|nr:translation initiation factor IF-2 N-terminal domain-containing protein [Oscillospiraceae bacterium]
MGNIVNRYKVNELAKDFGMQTKQIIEILGKYFDTPKKSGQNLDERELNVVFEYLTQNNQVSSIQSIYADTPPAESAKPAASHAPAQEQQRGSQKAGPAGKPAQQPAGGARPQQNGQPGAQQRGGQPAQQQAKPQPAQQQPASRVPKTKVVDTRKATNVNLDKYDEKLQDMA